MTPPRGALNRAAKKLLVSPIVLIGAGFLFVGAMADLVVCWVDRLCDWAEK